MCSLSAIGVRTLMVEGGASVIASFLNSGFVDRLIVTVSPTLVGNGVGYDVGEVSVSILADIIVYEWWADSQSLLRCHT